MESYKSIGERLVEFENDIEQKEILEGRDVLLAINDILQTDSGKCLFRYLFKNLDVVALPEEGLTGDLLMERLGTLKAGRSVFKLVSQANSIEAARILSELEKESYEREIKRRRIESGVEGN